MKHSKYAILGATLIDGNGGAPVRNSLILVDGDRITAVGTMDTLSVPEGYAPVSGEGMTLMPGFIDAHVHLYMGEHDICIPGSGMPLGLADHPCLRVLKSYEYAQHTIQAGFTTIRDAGDLADNVIQLRNAINQGIVRGPRIISSNQHLSITGGHLAPYPAWLHRTDHINNACDGKEDVLKAVRHQIRMGADWIKFFATGGISDPHDTQEFSDEEIAVIVGEAHCKHKKVFAHCMYEEGTMAAVRGGIDSVEHGARLTEEICDEMIARGTWLVPTLCVLDASATLGPAFGIPDWYCKKAAWFYDCNFRSLQLAHQKGVKIAFGSDSGFDAQKHGMNGREFVQYVKAGFSPMDAIVCATKRNSELLGLADQLGTVAVGKQADLVMVDGDPLEDISILQDSTHISMVMRSGNLFRLNHQPTAFASQI